MELPDYPWLTWDQMVALRNDLVQHGLPDDPTDVRVRLAEAIANAENLRILFAGQWDESSRKFAWDLAEEYRVAALWRKQATHSASSRRH